MFLQSRTMTIAAAIFALAFCQVCLAQMGGGMMGPGMAPTPGSTISMAPSGGHTNSALVGGLAGGGAAAAAGIYYLTHRDIYKGCVGPDGTTLTRDKDGRHFQFQGTRLTPGEKVTVKAKKSANDTTGSTLEVQDVRRDFGPCELHAKR